MPEAKAIREIIARTPIDIKGDGQATIAGVRPEVLREQYGSPLFVLDTLRLSMNCTEIRSAFQSPDFPIGIYYAVKANSNVNILRRIRSHIPQAEVNSLGEIKVAKQAGFRIADLIMHGNAKSDEELRYAVSHKIFLIVVDSIGELSRINAISKNLRKKTDVAIRVNFGVTISSPWKASSAGSKFGISETEVPGLFQAAKQLRNIKVVGLHSHIGSQVESVSHYIKLIKKISQLHRNLLSQGCDINIIDIGGGFPVDYRFAKTVEQESSLLSERTKVHWVAEQIIHAFKKQFEHDSSHKPPTLLIEPGRCIVASAGVLLTTVQEVKQTHGRCWIAVDAGCHNLPDCWIHDWYFECIPGNLSENNNQLIESHIAGPLCDSNDVIGKSRWLPAQKRGDILLFLQVGAYQIEQQNCFNLRPTARVVLIEDGASKLIQEKYMLFNNVRPDNVDKEVGSCPIGHQL